MGMGDAVENVHFVVVGGGAKRIAPGGYDYLDFGRVYEILMAEIETELWVCASAVARAAQKIENQGSIRIQLRPLLLRACDIAALSLRTGRGMGPLRPQ